MGESSTKGGRWPTAGEGLLAALAALMVLALGLGGAERGRTLTLERRESADRTVLADVTAGVAAELERSIAALTISQGRAVPNAQVVSVPRGDPAVPCSAEVPAFLDDPATVLLLRRACDSGQAEIGEPVDLGQGPRLPVAPGPIRRPQGARRDREAGHDHGVVRRCTRCRWDGRPGGLPSCDRHDQGGGRRPRRVR